MAVPSVKGRSPKPIEPALNEKALKGRGLNAPKSINKNVLS